MTFLIISLGCLFLILAVFVSIIIRLEIKGYNNGFCPVCGEWLQKEEWPDSHGDDVYRCHKCGYKISVEFLDFRK